MTIVEIYIRFFNLTAMLSIKLCFRKANVKICIPKGMLTDGGEGRPQSC